ncbi:DUF59 domain-containing protein [Patescibacteria group bacterium]|nr:DUF59 domain-containing protein [Patescibacteria group bacterium]
MKISKQDVIDVLKQCNDPEIPVNIYDLGLIYNIDISENQDNETFNVNITMSLTTPGCPMSGSIANEVKEKLEALPEVNQASVEITFDPPWNSEMMSEDAKANLGF